MKATQALHNMGQSIWLDNITRGLLISGTLRRYIQEFSVTGLTGASPRLPAKVMTCWPSSIRPAFTLKLWGTSFRSKERLRSSSPGMSCCYALRPRTRHSKQPEPQGRNNEGSKPVAPILDPRGVQHAL